MRLFDVFPSARLKAVDKGVRTELYGKADSKRLSGEWRVASDEWREGARRRCGARLGCARRGGQTRGKNAEVKDLRGVGRWMEVWLLEVEGASVDTEPNLVEA